MKRIFQCLFLLLCGWPVAGQSSKFSPTELKADLHYLHDKLKAQHPGLYLYSSRQTIDQLFDSLQNDLADSLTETQFYHHLSCISSVIKDGHTILLPRRSHHDKNSRFLPYHFAVINQTIYVDQVCTSDTRIPEGAEITRINDLNATTLLDQLMERQIRDGHNSTYPTWILGNYLREYYAFNFGHHDQFEIGYRVNGETATATIAALPKDSIYRYRQQRYPNKIFTKQPGDGIQLQIGANNEYALLTIRDFHNEVLQDEYKQHFSKTIRNYFRKILDSKTTNLILDLRNNQGGDVENGVMLLSYLFKKPFKVLEGYACVNKNGSLKPCGGPALGSHNPNANGFNGNLYVLVNGGSFSNSGIVASCLKAYNRAIFIGEETGGNPHVINGDSKDIELPNTGIYAEIPTKQYIIRNTAANNGRGIFPDHSIKPTIQDLLRGVDTALAFTVGLIRKH